MWRSIIVALALICLGLLGYYAVTKRAAQISAKLQATANAAVAAKVDGVTVQVTQRDARLAGVVDSGALRSEAERIVLGVSGIKAVVANDIKVEAPRPEEPKGPEAPTPPTTPPPTIDPNGPTPVPTAPVLGLKVVWDGATVTASGNVPADLKKEIGTIFMTDYPDAPVKDTIVGTTGTATPEQAAALRTAVRALARTQSGSVSVDEADFELSGKVANADDEAALKKLVGDEVKGLASTVTVTLADTAVADADAGAAPDAAVVEEVAAAVPAPAEGELTAAQCQTAIDEIIAAEKRITFKPGGGRLTDDGEAKLQAVWTVLQRCPTVKGTIIGYADDMGEPDAVKGLTQARAYNVHKRLVELGMPKERMRYLGAGQRNFKYPLRGDTRVWNQRIEFKLEVQ